MSVHSTMRSAEFAFFPPCEPHVGDKNIQRCSQQLIFVRIGEAGRCCLSLFFVPSLSRSLSICICRLKCQKNEYRVAHDVSNLFWQLLHLPFDDCCSSLPSTLRWIDRDCPRKCVCLPVCEIVCVCVCVHIVLSGHLHIVDFYSCRIRHSRFRHHACARVRAFLCRPSIH